MITKNFERAKNKIDSAPAKRAERKARAGREFLFPEPLFLPAPPERKLSEISVGIFAEEGSDFIQKRQQDCKVSVSRLARGFAPRFGGRIFKQFPNEPIFFSPEVRKQSGNLSRQSRDCPKAI